MACWIPGPYAMAWSAGKRRRLQLKAAAEAAKARAQGSAQEEVSD